MDAEISAIEDALVAAFRAMPGRAYYRLAAGLRAAETGRHDGALAILGEAAAALAGDPTALDYLLGWARCQAWPSLSFAEYCRVRGWTRSSAEKGRRRGAARIARARRCDQR